MLTRVALYTALGYVLHSVGAEWNTWPFWCVIALFWAAERNAVNEIIESLRAELTRLEKEEQQ